MKQNTISIHGFMKPVPVVKIRKANVFSFISINPGILYSPVNHELHLSDASIDVLRTGKFNHRLLSELICHKDFQRFMLDAEIYVDLIADMRVNDMNAVLEAVRQIALMKNGSEENDLHLRTLEVAQIREDEYFGSLIADDLKGILRDIRSEHRPDTMTADEVSFAENIQN